MIATTPKTSFRLSQVNYGLIGHRGVAKLRPENTLASITHARELGLNWVEIDARITKDNSWVVMHDASLDRTTDATGPVIAKTLNELQEISAGNKFSPEYAAEMIPSVQAAIAHAAEHNVNLNLEIKTDFIRPIDQAVSLHKYLKSCEFISHLLISSFDFVFLSHLREMEPSLKLSWLIDKFTPYTCAIAKKHDFAAIGCDVTTTTKRDLIETTSYNIPLLLYTVNEVEIITAWLEQGITAIFTDDPTQIIQATKQQPSSMLQPKL